MSLYKKVCGDDVTEASHLAEMMAKFFYALNVRNFSHGVTHDENIISTIVFMFF